MTYTKYEAKIHAKAKLHLTSSELLNRYVSYRMSPIIAEDDDFSVGKVGSEPLPYCTVIVSKPASFARCANSLQQTTSTNLSNDVVPTVTNIDFIECCCDRWLVCYKCKCLLYISFVIHFFFLSDFHDLFLRRLLS